MKVYRSFQKTKVTVVYEAVDLRQLTCTNISSGYDGDICIYFQVSL